MTEPLHDILKLQGEGEKRNLALPHIVAPMRHVQREQLGNRLTPTIDSNFQTAPETHRKAILLPLVPFPTHLLQCRKELVPWP
jgi:hypothetical protein